MPSSGGGAQRLPLWELRAFVTEDAYSFLERQARSFSRARSRHVGLIVQAFAAVARSLTEPERAQLDLLVREPEQLLLLIRRGLRER